ncbi:MAG: sugar-binding domain-containing protein [Syntrophomonadaceae bacterium]|nr:sugar-binding domain-containing protein [Syntrophomonadaceae bacterium]
MNRLFTIMERFAPEALEIMEVRYRILRQVLHKQPIGRRQICKDLGYAERSIRGEVDVLKSRGAVIITPAGVCLTPYGEEMINAIDEFLPFLFNIQLLAEEIKRMFDLEEVVLVPGDSYKDYMTKKDLGRAAARFLRKNIETGFVIAVTGGSTLAEIADAINNGSHIADVLVVPARGGLGGEVEQQAGTIAAKIARAIGAKYRLLHIPDNLDKDTVEILRKDSHISEVVDIIKSSNILIHGIGSALEMANRRGLTDKEIKYLEKKRAVGEVFRYYFDERGNIVYEAPGIGLELADLRNIDKVVAVAGGSNKADAIKAVLSNRQQNVLITDEGAAKRIILKRKGGDDAS